MCSSRASLEDRLKLEEHSGTSNMADTAVGSKQLTFTLKKVKLFTNRTHKTMEVSNGLFFYE